MPAIGWVVNRWPAVVNSVQLNAMIPPYSWACSLPGEACARLHCRPLYFQGLTVLGSNTQSLIVRPLRRTPVRSEEHTSELQSRLHLVCRLLLEKKKQNIQVVFCLS